MPCRVFFTGGAAVEVEGSLDEVEQRLTQSAGWPHLTIRGSDREVAIVAQQVTHVEELPGLTA